MNLSELSDYLILVSNDFKMLHLNCVGLDFMTIHSWLEDLYNDSSDYYDTVAEMAIEHDEKIENPTLALERVNNYIPFTNFDALTECDVLNKMYDIMEFIIMQLESINDDYESYVYSNIDEMTSSFRKNMYKLKQTFK